MGAVRYDDIDEIKKIPLEKVVITTSASGGTTFYFEILEEGSTFTVKPITTTNDTGGESIVAWAIEVEAIVLQNNYEEMLPALESFAYDNATDLDISLEAYVSDPAGEQLWITADEVLEVNDVNVHWTIDYQGYPAPKLKIIAKNILSKEAISMSTTKLFTQYW